MFALSLPPSAHASDKVPLFLLPSGITKTSYSQTIVRYHLTPKRMVIIKKSTNKICWRRCVEKGTLIYFW